MVSDAPSAVTYDVHHASTAWDEVLSKPADDFSYVIFTFPENLFAKTLDVHKSSKGGMREMLHMIEELTKDNVPCWGGFKVLAINGDASSRVTKFIGFQYIPTKAKINAKRVAKEIKPCVEEMLGRADIFLQVDQLDQLSDAPANCKLMADRLELKLQDFNNAPAFSKSQKLDELILQFHAVENVAAVEVAVTEVLECAVDDFSYVIVTAEEAECGKKTLTIQRSLEGGSTEMLDYLQNINQPCWGVFKVQGVDALARDRVSKYVGFEILPHGACGVASEVRPHMVGVMGKVDAFLQASGAHLNIASVSSEVQLPEGYSLQLHTVENVEGVKAAVEEVMGSELNHFAFVVITVEENLHGKKTLNIQRSTEGGSSELLDTLQKVQERPSWGAFKVECRDGANQREAKYVGFEVVPKDMEASQLVSEVKPHIMAALEKTHAFMHVTNAGLVVDPSMISAELHLPDGKSWQFHSVKGASDVAAAYQEIINAAVDHFAYVLVFIEKSSFGNTTLKVCKSNEGGLTEMLEQAKGCTSCFGAFKVQLVSETCACVAKYVGFQYCVSGEIALEIKPFVVGAFENIDLFIETDTLEKLKDLRAELRVASDLTLQYRSIKVEAAAAAWQEVLRSDVDAFAYVIFVVSDDRVTALDVYREVKGGMEEMVEKVKELSAKGLPLWGGFKVQASDDKSLLKKRTKHTKYVGFQYIPEEAKTEVLDVIPFACNALDKLNLDMFIETSDIADVANIEAISHHLKLNERWMMYEFGGTVRCRTETMVDLDKLGTQKLEVAQALDAWDRVLSNNDDATYCIFSLSANRKKLNVIDHGRGSGQRACEAAVGAILESCLQPVWGCFRVKAKVSSAHVTKYIGFQLIPPNTKPLVLAVVNLVKPLLMRTLRQAVVWVEAESTECIAQDMIMHRFGREDAVEYDFGEELDAENEKAIKKRVDSYINSVQMEPAVPA